MGRKSGSRYRHRFAATLIAHAVWLSRYYGGGDESLQALAVDSQAQAGFTTGPVNHTVFAGLDHQQRRTKNDWLFAPVASIDAFNPVYGNVAPGVGSPMKATRKLEQTGVHLQDQIELNRCRSSLGDGTTGWKPPSTTA